LEKQRAYQGKTGFGMFDIAGAFARGEFDADLG